MARARVRWRAALALDLRRGGPFHIGFLLENVPELTFWLGAGAVAGATMVGINPTRQGSELETDIRHTDCQLIVTESALLPLLSGLDIGVGVERILVVDDASFAERRRPYESAGFPDAEVPATRRRCCSSPRAHRARRALTFFILGGVLERHPNLRLVMSEQGAGWVPDHLAVLDRYASYGTLVRDPLGGGHLSLSPSEYFARQCYVGASFLAPPELAQLDRIGVDRVLWGSDYPHREGTWPYSRESLRFTFAGIDPAIVRRMVGTNAAALYGFDLDALAPLAAAACPTPADISVPLTTLPTDTISPAFDTYAGSR